MAPEPRHPRRVTEDPIHDQIVVAADSEVSVSSDDVYSPRRQAINYPDFGGHPTTAKGPNLALAVGDTASRSAPEPVADEPSKLVELSTRQRGHSKSRRKLQGPDGSFDVPGKGKARATPASEEKPSRKKASTSHRVYCAPCQERKSQPATTGTGKRMNGNAKHKCPDCALLKNKAPEQAERPLGEREARWPAQPERQYASTAGKERPRPPKQNNGPPIKPIPGKQELVALPSSKAYQQQDDGSEFDTEPDDPHNPPLPNNMNRNMDRFGAVTAFVNTNQTLTYPSASPSSVDPALALLQEPWGQVHAQVARHPGLKPTSSDPMLNGEERVPANPLPAFTSDNNSYDYANPDSTPEQQKMAEFMAYIRTDCSA